MFGGHGGKYIPEPIPGIFAYQLTKLVEMCPA